MKAKRITTADIEFSFLEGNKLEELLKNQREINDAMAKKYELEIVRLQGVIDIQTERISELLEELSMYRGTN